VNLHYFELKREAEITCSTPTIASKTINHTNENKDFIPVTGAKCHRDYFWKILFFHQGKATMFLE